MRYLSRITLILALLGGPWTAACFPHAAERATNASIGGLLAFDLTQCIEKNPDWAGYDACQEALTACARQAKTVSDYDLCSDRVVR